MTWAGVAAIRVFLPSLLYYSFYQDGHSPHHLPSPGAAFDFTAVTTVLLTSVSDPCRELAINSPPVPLLEPTGSDYPKQQVAPHH